MYASRATYTNDKTTPVTSSQSSQSHINMPTDPTQNLDLCDTVFWSCLKN